MPNQLRTSARQAGAWHRAAALAALATLTFLTSGAAAGAATVSPSTFGFGNQPVGTATCKLQVGTAHLVQGESWVGEGVVQSANNPSGSFQPDTGTTSGGSSCPGTPVCLADTKFSSRAPKDCPVYAYFSPQATGAATGTAFGDTTDVNGVARRLTVALTGNGTPAPPPAVPEAPFAVLLPTVGAAIAGLSVLMRRRLTSRTRQGAAQ